MLAERYIQKELELIHPLYFSIFDDKKQRWHIRKWKSRFLSNHKINNWRFDSTNILTIRKENETGSDIGYMQLDRRAIRAIREGLYWARNAKILLQQVDDSNQYMEEKADEEMDYITRYMAKNIWKYYREATVILGG